jgi:hypothetical protein
MTVWLAFLLASPPTGELRGLVFDDSSAPVAGAAIQIGDVATTTDHDGAFSARLPAGLHILAVPTPTGPVEQPITIAADAVTEVLVSLNAAGVEFEVETPGGAEPTTETAREEAGTIRGRVTSIETGEPIAAARIFVRGLEREATSAGDGTFALTLPAGAWDLSILHVEHSTRSLANVEVAAGRTTDVDVEMTPAAQLLGTLTVSAPRLEGGTASFLDERRTAASVSDVLGAEQMSKAGDSNAAAALLRVTGLTIVDGKYVYVRGLGDRYSSALLNGSTLPSPEPERRVIPLDVFPTKLLEGVVIPKTYSVDLPGEFGGGSIQLRTRPIPSEPVRQIELSLGAEAGTTMGTGLGYAGGSFDFLGIDDGTRALPGGIERASNDSPLKERDRFSETGYTTEELERFGERMPNRWATEARTVPPALGLSAALGDRFTLAGKPFGYLAALTYGDGWNNEQQERTYYLVGADNELEPAHNYAFESTERNVRLGGVLNLGVELDDEDTLAATTTLVRVTSDETRTYEGFNKDVDTRIRVSRLRWIERMLLSQQVTGKHTFAELGNLQLDWRYTFSRASRYEPDRREYRYDLEPQTGVWSLSDRPEGNHRVVGELVDT